jgi:hypothetical protein
MNIQELDSYDLGDAVKFNDSLNPKLFGPDEKLLPQVREQLLKIADDFKEFLGIKDLQIKDITVSGSNAAYTYTDHSDIDLHLVVDLPEADENEVYRELFDAKKYAYNDQHDIQIGGYDVELYVQDANKKHHSQGIYSLINDNWISVPKRRQPDVDDISVKAKFEDLGHRIEAAVSSGDYEKILALSKKIKEYRQAGLDAHGEFGPENLAFKILRTQGLIQKLIDARNSAKDQLLSLDERRKKKKSKVRYGYSGYWYPGTAYAGQDHAAGTEGGGGDGGGGESIRESVDSSDEDILRDFIRFCVAELKIQHMPRVKLRKDPQWSQVHKTFGRYDDSAKTLEVAWGQRHIMDVLRTVAHELTHKHQHERDGERMGPDAGETGSPYENEANARAGVLMRDYGRLHPEYFAVGQAHDLEESASGYIPTRAQAKDPRFSMALTVDIKPGQVGKEANKLKLKTDKQGHPQIARANGLFENLYKEYKRYKADEDYSPDNPPGPESKPTMPKGTVRVDVSDVYDWYKLGQHISNMKGLGQHDFGKGPPSSIISFGDEDTEHEFIKDLEATGLDVTDIDPVDPKQPPGRKIKTDPTYNVDEAIQAPISKNQDAEQYYKFILGKAKLGRPLTRAEQDYVKMYQVYRQQKLAEDEDLDEVKMSPSALEKFAASKEAQGIRAGFEAELIFRDTQGESDEMDPEPDYDADERAYSISQVIEFFENDEYGYGMSDRERNRLEENLDETYMNWRDEQMTSDFRNEAEDLVREIHLDEVPLSERIIKVLTDGMEIDDAEADKILALGVDAPRFTKSSEQQAYAEQNPNYKIYLEALDDAEAILDEEVETSIEKQDGYYDQALDDYRDNWSGDDDSFFSDVGLRWMSDIANEYGLDWPVWNMSNGGNSGSRSWSDIGTELQALVGMPVVVSDNYHSTRRKEGQWIIEPDGSLNPDDRSEEAGLEIVSPPMPLLMALDKLRAITDWANDPQGGNAYTNSSTGLHMGVSLPRIRAEDDNDRAGIDYVKLILFMGDKYVLEKFGREANTYTASALEKFKQNIRGGRSDPAGVVKLLKHGLTELAYRELQKGVGTSKYTSAHIQDGYIEFRSPGGDWLAKADEEIGVLENTMMRFARAMQIAGDPAAERQEYAKKLYKLVTADNEQYADQLRLFSQFAAGELSAEQLKKQWAEKTIGTEKKANQRWKLYQKSNGTWTPVPGGEWNGYTEDQVKNAVWSKYGREALDSGEYQLVNMGEQEWEVYDVKTGNTLEVVKGKSKGEVADAVYDKYVDQGVGFNVRPYEDPSKLTPRAKLAKRIATKKPEPRQVANQATNERGVPYWEIYSIKDDWNVIHTFLSDTAADAKVDGANWLTSTGVKYPDRFAVRAKIVPNPQAANAKRDSVDPQRRLGVQDVDTDVAQNFAPDYSAYERNSDRIDAIRAQARQPRQNYELVTDEDPDRVIHRMNDATADEVRAWIAQQEQGGMPAGFLRTRIVAESINPISGAGAVPPRPVIKKKSTDRVEPVEPVVRSQKPRSAIGQAIDLTDIENMTQQIQMARRLGDDVNENFADGKVKGKSRPGRVKRSGASCNGSVTDLRKRAKNASGEKAKMYHWCANMKSGRKK